LHAKMERWVDESKIRIADYKPRLLGKTDEEAVRGFQERMAELISYSQIRALQLKPLVEKLNKRINQPLELDCALETARVTADIVHTLFTLGRETMSAAEGVLEGTIEGLPPTGYASVPAKVMLAGTSYATTCNAQGRFQLRRLPPGRYSLWLLATGYECAQETAVELKAGKTTYLSKKLATDAVPGNLVRNPRFQLEWIKPGQPDWWSPDKIKAGRWTSALIRVPVVEICSVGIEFQAGKQVPVGIRWRSNPALAADSLELPLTFERQDASGRLVAQVTPDRNLKPFEKGFLYLELLLKTEAKPNEVCRHAAVTFVK